MDGCGTVVTNDVPERPRGFPPRQASRKDAVDAGTIEQALPGLENATSEAALKPGHAIPLTPQKRLMVFSGRSHPVLAERIAERLNVDLGEIELKTFANGETYAATASRSAAPTCSSSRPGARPSTST